MSFLSKNGGMIFGPTAEAQKPMDNGRVLAHRRSMIDDLQCGRCGAPLPPAAAQSVVTCTYCGASSTPGPRVVEHRVERVVVVAASGDQEAPGTLHCPRCGGALREARSDRSPLLVCRPCGGVWAENTTVERLTRVRDDDITDTVRRAVGPFAPKPGDPRREVSCPVCSSALRRVAVPNAEATVDTCTQHGTWFDWGEIPAFIQGYVDLRSGELDDDDLAAAGLPGHRK